MIEVIFPTGYDEVTIPALNQWDYGQVLNISGIDLSSLSDPSTVQVHFSDKSCVDAKVRLGAISNNKIAVQIPDILLANQYDVHAFIYLTNPNSGVTIKKIIIPVIPRKKPEDYVAIDDNFYESVLQAIENKVDVIKTQVFDEEEKAKGRSNINAMVDITKELETALTDEQKAQARTNIDVYSKTEMDNSVVKYSSGQSLTDEQKAQARTNIGAVGSADSQYTVKVVEQSFTDEQKTQARNNINAASQTEMTEATNNITTLANGVNALNEVAITANQKALVVNEYNRQLNLFKNKKLPMTSSGITIIPLSYSSYKLNGINTSSYNWDINDLADYSGLDASKTYTLKMTVVSGSGECGLSGSTTAKEVTQTGESLNTYSNKITIKAGETYDNLIVTMMLVEGSTAADYIEYEGKILHDAGNAINAVTLYQGIDFTGSATKTFANYKDFKYLIFTVVFNGSRNGQRINVIFDTGSDISADIYEGGGTAISTNNSYLYSVLLSKTFTTFKIKTIGYMTGSTWTNCLTNTEYFISKVVGIK